MTPDHLLAGHLRRHGIFSWLSFLEEMLRGCVYLSVLLRSLPRLSTLSQIKSHPHFAFPSSALEMPAIQVCLWWELIALQMVFLVCHCLGDKKLCHSRTKPCDIQGPAFPSHLTLERSLEKRYPVHSTSPSLPEGKGTTHLPWLGPEVSSPLCYLTPKNRINEVPPDPFSLLSLQMALSLTLVHWTIWAFPLLSPTLLHLWWIPGGPGSRTTFTSPACWVLSVCQARNFSMHISMNSFTTPVG